MHTAQQLDAAYFDVSLDGRQSTPADVFPLWTPSDRLGIVVTSPLGAVGASLLLQLAITAFYDARPSRRSQPLYPEIHLFHVGRMFGDHMYYDVFPARKEVLVPSDPALILEEINNRAITRLAVVDGPVVPVDHFYKEPSSARDRITSAFAYSASGRVVDPDVTVTATDKRAVTNTRMTLKVGSSYAAYVEERAKADNDEFAGGVPRLIPGEKLQGLGGRDGEVSDEVKLAVAAQRENISTAGLPMETYRRVDIDDALLMLVNGA